MELLVSAEQLHQALAQRTDLLVIDLSGADRYASGHIPGAVHLAPSALLCGIKPAAGRLPEIRVLEALFSDLGIGPDTHVVACDDEGGGWAARLLWTLAVLGHRRYSFLNGGIHAWRGAELPQETGIPRPTPRLFRARFDAHPLAEIGDILPRLGDADFAVWDARSPEEHSGEKALAARGGRIPGAINLHWLELFDPDNHYKLRDLDPLQ
jgi:thiosulfate/3-mercaptopyruvate sulfurtransferase